MVEKQDIRIKTLCTLTTGWGWGDGLLLGPTPDRAFFFLLYSFLPIFPIPVFIALPGCPYSFQILTVDIENRARPSAAGEDAFCMCMDSQRICIFLSVLSVVRAWAL